MSRLSKSMYVTIKCKQREADIQRKLIEKRKQVFDIHPLHPLHPQPPKKPESKICNLINMSQLNFFISLGVKVDARENWRKERTLSLKHEASIG